VTSPLAILSILWVLWLLSWFLASMWTADTATQQSTGSRVRESLPIWIGAFLIARPPRGALAAPLFTKAGWVEWLAVALAASGLVFTWWARVHLGRLWSSRVEVKVGHAVIRSGPYAIVRHPIYSGLLLAMAASAVARDTAAAALGVLGVTAGLVMRLRHEERLLCERLGDAYRSYRREVAALIPYIW
jgi:protein-S-isoprenylcysteine O-methyltransferase Ste14